MVSLTIPGEPMAKGRPRFGKGYIRTPERTVNYETLVKQLFIISKQEKLEGMLQVEIDCYFKIPNSTPKYKVLLMMDEKIRPIKKPDIDNVAKICLDGLSGLAYKDDSQVVSLLINKWYGNDPRVEIRIEEVKP